MSVATIQKIYNITKHVNADSLSVARVLGWQVVFNHTQHQYQEGDLVVYVEMDSILPNKPEFEFLQKVNYRIKAVTLRGVESAGIVFPVEEILPKATYVLGQDVSEIIGAKHYEKPIPVEMQGEVFGGLPGFLMMTDEKNIRSFPEVLTDPDGLRGKEYYITRKDDGTSATYFWNNGEFGVCSRKLHLKPSDTNLYWRLARKYEVEKFLREYFMGQNVAIQAEIVGPSINENRLGLSELELHTFNVWFIDERTYGTYFTVRDFCNETNIPMVTLLEMGDKFNYNLEGLIKFANRQKYPNATPAEGIVIRSQFPIRCMQLGGWWSGKIINENWKE